MIYCPERKLAFAMPPRTGTTTFSRLLKEWGFQEHQYQRHLKPKEVTIDGFEKYQLYGFFRDPLERFLSLLRYMQLMYSYWDQVKSKLGYTESQWQSLSYDELIDLFPSYEKILPFYFDPQVTWLETANVLDFRNYDLEVLKIAKLLEIKKVTIAVHNHTELSAEKPSQKVIDFVKNYYDADYRFGAEKGMI